MTAHLIHPTTLGHLQTIEDRSRVPCRRISGMDATVTPSFA